LTQACKNDISRLHNKNQTRVDHWDKSILQFRMKEARGRHLQYRCARYFKLR